MSLIDALKADWSVQESRPVELSPTGKKIFIRPLSLRQKGVLEGISLDGISLNGNASAPEAIAKGRINFLIQIAMKDKKSTPFFTEADEDLLLNKIQGRAVINLMSWLEGKVVLPKENGVYVLNGWEPVKQFPYTLEVGGDSIDLWIKPPSYLDQARVGARTRNGMDFREALVYFLVEHASESEGGSPCFTKNDADTLYRLNAEKMQPLLLAMWNNFSVEDESLPKSKAEPITEKP